MAEKSKQIRDNVSSLVAAGFFISLGWSLRGQFGHLKGAMVPGALAVLFCAFAAKDPAWRRGVGRALFLSTMGFGLGGHFGYGEWIDQILAGVTWPVLGKYFFLLFLTGALWGGLGMGFLGFAYSEKPWQRRDTAILLFWLAVWLLFLGILNLEAYDHPLFALGLFSFWLYNSRVKKSRNFDLFLYAGFIGFGTAFVVAVLILFLGNQFGGAEASFPWWTLRDQIFGFIAGVFLWLPFREAQSRGILPHVPTDENRFQRFWMWSGMMMLTVVIPGLNVLNVYGHWAQRKLVNLSSGYGWVLIAVLVTIAFWFLYLLKLNTTERMSYDTLRHLKISGLYFIWLHSLLAISKEVVLVGWQRWELGFYWILISALVVSLFIVRSDPLQRLDNARVKT